jgi:hypothetical protein
VAALPEAAGCRPSLWGRSLLIIVAPILIMQGGGDLGLLRRPLADE